MAIGEVARHKWITQGGDIGTVPELEFIDIPLEVTNPTQDNIIFDLISGELPPGVQIERMPGAIQGVPVVLDPLPVDEARTYRFSIRASSTSGIVTDRSFEITVTNLFPPYITPRTANLGTVFDGTYYKKQLSATEPNPNAVLNWTVASGQLPPGITLSSSGLISGYITIESTDADNVIPGYDAQSSGGSVAFYDVAGWDTLGRSRNRKYTFTVQVSDGSSVDSLTYQLGIASKILFTADQDHTSISGSAEQPIAISADNDELSIDADNRYVPVITTPPASLPQVRQENFFAYKFDALDFEGDPIEFQFRLAEGGSFDQGGGAIFGWKDPRNGNGVTGQFEPNEGRAKNNPRTVQYFDTDEHELAYNLITENYPVGSQFDIIGVWYETDAGVVTIFEEGVDFTVNVTNTLVTVTDPADVPDNGRLAVDFYIILPDNTFGVGSGLDEGLYDQSESKLPPTLTIDANGWLNGYVDPQVEDRKVYEFIISANKIEDATYESAPVQFALTILGSLTDTITWVTPTDLGSLIPGEVSQLSVQATSANGQAITYSIEEDTKVNTPQGLSLDILPNGFISGRTSFRTFQMDSGVVTFDKGKTLFDNKYEFTVTATTVDGLVSSNRTFTLRLNPRYTRPYENLYLKALPTQAQRQSFLDIVNNQAIFPDNLIFRKEDPWFGRAKTIKFLALAGVNPSTLASYTEAIDKNHYTKKIDFGKVKTARAVDEFYNVKYEVVYVEVEDPQNINDTDVTLSNKVGTITPPMGGQFFLDSEQPTINKYIDEQGVEYDTIYPNTFENMNTRVINSLGYSARGVFPDWMLSVQEDKTVIGFKRAVVLAYTVPGASKLIAYRLKSNNVSFSKIEFVVDRYQLDNVLSKNFDIPQNQFLPSEETTYDRLLIGPGELQYPVTYAVEQSFDSIHLRTKAYINDNQAANPLLPPGIDGTKNYKHGETLIFAKQEGFANVASPDTDGWVEYQNLFVGDIPGDGIESEAVTENGERVSSSLTSGNANWTFSNGTVSIKATGLPYHSRGNPAAPFNSAAQSYSMTWSNHAGRDYPNSGTKTPLPLNHIGFWLNGVAIYNPAGGDRAPIGMSPIAGMNFNLAFQSATDLGYSFGDDLAGGHADVNGVYSYRDRTFTQSWTSGIGATDNSVGGKELEQIPYIGSNLAHPDGHSKILGWSLDGYPIYGPNGYTNYNDNTSAVIRMTSAWAIKSDFSHRTGVANDPSTYPLGIFIEDFEHVGGGTLDKWNGRYCVTPDYPTGTYAYFVTEDADGDAVYPYVIGQEYYGYASAFDISTSNSGLGFEPAGTDLISSGSMTDYDGVFGFDSYKVIPGFRERGLTISQLLLVNTAASGSTSFDVEYQYGADLIGKAFLAPSNDAIPDNTKILQQQTVDISVTPGVVSLVTRLVVNNPSTIGLTKGSPVDIVSAVTSTQIGVGDTIIVDSIPSDLKPGMSIQGKNIPAETYIRAVDSGTNRIETTSQLSTVESGTIIRYLQTNQRAGIWRINITGTQTLVNFDHTAHYALNYKWSDIHGQAWSTFLLNNPNAIDGVRSIADLQDKELIFLGDIGNEDGWTPKDIWDLTRYDPDAISGTTIPYHNRRQVWKLTFQETDIIINQRVAPSDVLDFDAFDEDKQFQPFILGKEYIMQLTLVTAKDVERGDRVRVTLGTYKDKDMSLDFADNYTETEIIISDELVRLDFVREIDVGTKIKVAKGQSYGFSFLTYDATLEADQTVPKYKYWKGSVEAEPGTDNKDYTRFDGGGTRFFNYRDSYHKPEDGDKYIKFPQIGVFT